MLKNIDQYMKEHKFSGSILITKEKEIIINKAFGYRDRANKLKNMTTTAFGIASGTKTFTALGILKLIDMKELSLESKVFDIIEQPYPTYDLSVTIHQMLCHLSGLPDYFDEDLIEDFENFTIDMPWHLLEKPSHYFSSMPDRAMKYKPNTKFHYNNGAYVMLAMVIEKLTGDYHQWLDDMIFRPLNLKNTGFYRLNALPQNTALGYIETEFGWKTNVYNLPIIGGGDGGLFTCSEDLLNVWDNLYAYKIISKELTKQMLSRQAHDQGDTYYGYGIWLNKEKAYYSPSMVGSDAGVSFLCFNDLIRDVKVIIISNTSEGTWNISKDIKALIKNL